MEDWFEVVQNFLYNRYWSSAMSGWLMVFDMVLCVVIGMYIFLVYRIVSRRSLYSRSFHISLPLITVITGVVIMTLQCSILVTLGALGALSIIRFRTAIKDPIDLVFIFWSIAEGIVCGADLMKLAICSTIVITLLIVLLEVLPGVRSPLYLILNLDNAENETDVLSVITEHTKRYQVKSRNINSCGMDMIVEVETKEESGLISAVSKLEDVKSASLVSQDGDINF